jgi:hypothetical protein
VPRLAAFGLVGSVGVAAFVATRNEARVVAERAAAGEAARVASRRAVFAGSSLAETLRFCRDGWREALALHQEPVALAWTRDRVDGYFVEGRDDRTLRQARCDASGVERGPRVARPLAASLPAESPPRSEGRDEGDAWSLAMAHLPDRLAEGEMAFELVRHPFTDEVFVRRWRTGASGAVAVTEPADAPPFPLLVAGRFPVAPSPSLAPLTVVPRFDWAARPDAAFAVIERDLPLGATVSEITFDADELQVQVAHPTKAFDDQPPAPFGEMDWDEYGVADRDWWYPREIPGFGCATGRPLVELHEEFAASWSAQGSAPLARAWYSCSTAYSNGRRGAWHLVPR